MYSLPRSISWLKRSTFDLRARTPQNERTVDVFTGAGEVQDVRVGREHRELPSERVLDVQSTRAGPSRRPASGTRRRPVPGRTEQQGRGGRRPFARHTERQRAGNDKFQDVAACGKRARQALQSNRGDVPGAGHGQLLRRRQYGHADVRRYADV